MKEIRSKIRELLNLKSDDRHVRRKEINRIVSELDKLSDEHNTIVGKKISVPVENENDPYAMYIIMNIIDYKTIKLKWIDGFKDFYNDYVDVPMKWGVKKIIEQQNK